MSVLNQGGEEPVECPLCMEPLEVDDLNFFPCTCGYQICRFCWHRIRTDENGLCPACRKAYPEDPADFKPLSKEDFARIKAEKRQKNQQKKQKITENRKSLGNVRVVQRNLVFVLGLPTRLADAEVLKRHEYFGKFGKILKVVVNQSTSYAGNQGPCASAYVTYSRSEDALRAIQAVNNISVDGRVIKTSLGTTKYCSHFMKNQQCPKTDCMYLHEMGDPEASFTKEEMQQGKHQEFEKKLHDHLINSTQQTVQAQQVQQNRKPTPSPPSVQLSACVNQYSSSNSSPNLQNVSPGTPSNSSSSSRNSPTVLASNSNTCNSVTTSTPTPHQQPTNAVAIPIATSPKEHWPSLRPYSPANSNYDDSINDTKEQNTCTLSDTSDSAENYSDSSTKKHNPKHSKKRYASERKIEEPDLALYSDTSDSLETQTSDMLQSVIVKNQCNPEIAQYTIRLDNSDVEDLPTVDNHSQQNSCTSSTVATRTFDNVHIDNNTSFFSSYNFRCNSNASHNEWLLNGEPHMPDVLPPVHSSEDWQAAFGFGTDHNGEITDDSVYRNDDDLGFDPFTETQKALAEMIENEKQTCGYYYHNNNSNSNNNNNNNNHNSSNMMNNNNNNNNHNHNSVYQKRFIAVQQNNRLAANCTKLLDELRIGNIPPRTHIPPPGFSNSANHMNAFGLGIPRTGNKILPFTQQTLTAFQQHTSPATWDWPSLDPAIVSATAQHCDLYATQPPPGFTLTPTIDSKYMFNNYI
ncbi:CCR4-NOT transcription complex subunit 4 isoform X2 [Planococcus citri]|uniref:CCR4-NOT transcription complex subunit 4 isoform X2 n=1 Tax=Planococcus citri TaxID=170843 RepID=UPI0031F8E1E0